MKSRLSFKSNKGRRKRVFKRKTQDIFWVCSWLRKKLCYAYGSS
ncbi:MULTISPECIES: hypothetical protein [Clostridium]